MGSRDAHIGLKAGPRSPGSFVYKTVTDIKAGPGHNATKITGVVFPRHPGVNARQLPQVSRSLDSQLPKTVSLEGRTRWRPGESNSDTKPFQGKENKSMSFLKTPAMKLVQKRVKQQQPQNSRPSSKSGVPVHTAKRAHRPQSAPIIRPEFVVNFGTPMESMVLSPVPKPNKTKTRSKILRAIPDIENEKTKIQKQLEKFFETIEQRNAALKDSEESKILRDEAVHEAAMLRGAFMKREKQLLEYIQSIRNEKVSLEKKARSLNEVNEKLQQKAQKLHDTNEYLRQWHGLAPASNDNDGNDHLYTEEELAELDKYTVPNITTSEMKREKEQDKVIKERQDQLLEEAQLEHEKTKQQGSEDEVINEDFRMMMMDLRVFEKELAELEIVDTIQESVGDHMQELINIFEDKDFRSNAEMKNVLTQTIETGLVDEEEEFDSRKRPTNQRTLRHYGFVIIACRRFANSFEYRMERERELREKSSRKPDVDPSWMDFLRDTPGGGLNITSDMEIMEIREVMFLTFRIYERKLESDIGDDEEGVPRQQLCDFVNDYFMINCGVRKVAQRQLKDLMLGLKMHGGSSLRIRTFSRFVNYYTKDTGHKYRGSRDLNFFLAVMRRIKDNYRETTDGIVFVKASSAVEAIKDTLPQLPAQAIEQMKKSLDKLQEEPPSIVLPKYTAVAEDDEIEFDRFMEVGLQLWDSITAHSNKLLENLFEKFDINHDQQLEMDEFRALIKALIGKNANVTDRMIERMYCSILKEGRSDKMDVATFVEACYQRGIVKGMDVR